MIQNCATNLGVGVAVGALAGLVMFRGGAARVGTVCGSGGFGLGYAYAKESMRFDITKAELASKLNR